MTLHWLDWAARGLIITVVVGGFVGALIEVWRSERRPAHLNDHRLARRLRNERQDI